MMLALFPLMRLWLHVGCAGPAWPVLFLFRCLCAWMDDAWTGQLSLRSTNLGRIAFVPGLAPEV